MKKPKIWIILGMAFVLLINGAFYVVMGDHGNQNKGMWHHEFLSDREEGKKGKNIEKGIEIVTTTTIILGSNI